MEHKSSPQLNSDELRQAINLETGKLSWQELQRHFARGVVVVISPELDLIDVAGKFIEDNKSFVEKWSNQGKITRANDDHAQHWNKENSNFWAVVIAPWVLVQEMMSEQ